MMKISLSLALTKSLHVMKIIGKGTTFIMSWTKKRSQETLKGMGQMETCMITITNSLMWILTIQPTRTTCTQIRLSLPTR